MAFLFKSKKNADKAQATEKGGVAGSVSSLQSSNGRMTQNEKGAVQQTTPASSVNNSLNSLQGGGTSTPSPEQLNGRRGPSSDLAQDPNVSPPIFLLITCIARISNFVQMLTSRYR
jgi:hypothetical protein